jgi:hypothetical protein
MNSDTGEPVFEGRIDEVLAGKIAAHSRRSAGHGANPSGDVHKANGREYRSRRPARSPSTVPIVAACALTVLLLVGLARLLRRLLRR